MTHLILISGYLGAGKTTAVKAVLAQGTRTAVETDSSKFFEYYPKNREVFSEWSLFNKKVCALGSYHSDIDTNRQGGDVFAMNKKHSINALVKFALVQNDVVLLDNYCVKTHILESLRGSSVRVSVLHIDTPYEVCLASRLQRARNKELLGKNFMKLATKVDNRLLVAEAFGCDVVLATRDEAPNALKELILN